MLSLLGALTMYAVAVAGLALLVARVARWIGREHDPEIDALIERGRAVPIRGMERPDLARIRDIGSKRWAEVEAAQKRTGAPPAA